MVSHVDADLTVFDGSVVADGITEQGLNYQPINLRLPRGTNLVFSSEAAAAAEFQMLCILGLYPAGMGQDVSS